MVKSNKHLIMESVRSAMHSLSTLLVHTTSATIRWYKSNEPLIIKVLKLYLNTIESVCICI